MPKWIRPDIELTPRTSDRLERHIITLLAGREAAKIHTGRNNHIGARSDMHYVVRFAEYLGVIAEDDDELWQAFYKYMLLRTRALLKRPAHWSAVEALSAALLACEPVRGIRRINEQAALEIMSAAWLACMSRLRDEISSRRKSHRR